MHFDKWTAVASLPIVKLRTYRAINDEFENIADIRQVAAFEVNNIDYGYGYVRKISFMDGAGREVKAYDPYYTYRAAYRVDLGENEELIGVYGVYGAYDGRFYSFGYIVKVKQY
eukprot:CAMPEP_0185622046 /NCGR_PEP_ID=MMETSP0436-20130131/58995_1 /TAXON_ID=626734 ORGANISM="Favella taraikaensis, Strain Fe Narragansett Bay" /NCGR_SAMPLE_ID=MMETSP0436 /ASSEMBLY_ACC=CAM_ASM_000390 /LENGTH=113 /DNA_ID=CAMNT_0028263711 /DNA_START=712 /DNA_END=1054 /DNA_ORIENTATION=+